MRRLNCKVGDKIIWYSRDEHEFYTSEVVLINGLYHEPIIIHNGSYLQIAPPIIKQVIPIDNKMEAQIKETTNNVTLHDMARKYADHHFPIPQNTTAVVPKNAVKHDIAFHSYCDGFNAALRMLMNVRNLSDPCQHKGDDPNFD